MHRDSRSSSDLQKFGYCYDYYDCCLVVLEAATTVAVTTTAATITSTATQLLLLQLPLLLHTYISLDSIDQSHACTIPMNATTIKHVKG